MNNDLISREALKKSFNKWWGCDDIPTIIVEDLIDEAPTVPLPDFKEGYKQAIIDGKTNFSRPQGEWVDEGQYADYHSEHAYMCSNCGWHIIKSPDLIFENRFCKHCGAEMKGGAELYREETCKSKDRCDDYKYWHCAGCNGCKKGGAENDT